MVSRAWVPGRVGCQKQRPRLQLHSNNNPETPEGHLQNPGAQLLRMSREWGARSSQVKPKTGAVHQHEGCWQLASSSKFRHRLVHKMIGWDTLVPCTLKKPLLLHVYSHHSRTAVTGSCSKASPDCCSSCSKSVN